MQNSVRFWIAAVSLSALFNAIALDRTEDVTTAEGFA